MFILALTILTLICTFIPYWDSRHWSIRGQEYLKSWYLFLNLIFFILLFLVEFHWFRGILQILTLVGAVHCFLRIAPFTKLWASKASPVSASSERALTIFIFNVYQFNEEYGRTYDKIKECDPDVIFLLETNAQWESNLKRLDADYPYQLKDIRDDTYGMMLLSRIPFESKAVKYLVSEQVPSVDVLFTYDNQKVQLLGLHPTPPSPTEGEYATSKDKELLRAARVITERKSNVAGIIVGDLNDVAWSRTSKKMRRITGMYDPRIGRGFYSTFPTWMPFRIPLDHIFYSEEFKLISFEIEENIGSDHFPVLIKLSVET